MLHNEYFFDLYRFVGVVRIVKSVRFRWTGLVARMRDKHIEIWWGDLLENRGHGRIMAFEEGKWMELANLYLLLTCILEVPNSNLGRDTDYPGRHFVDLFKHSREIPVRYLKLGHDRFLPHPLQVSRPLFTIIQGNEVLSRHFPGETEEDHKS
jgi:hypothetical protein